MSDTIIDAVIVATIVPMKLWMNLPAPSGKKNKGKKAKTKTPVDPKTAIVISLVPSIAASLRLLPMRKCRAIFSTTTIESSTNSPNVRMKPATTSWLRLNPYADIASNPDAIESGIDIITMTDARQPKGNSVMRTKNNAMPKSRASSFKRFLISLLWSNWMTASMSGGNNSCCLASSSTKRFRSLVASVPCF